MKYIKLIRKRKNEIFRKIEIIITLTLNNKEKKKRNKLSQVKYNVYELEFLIF